MNRNPEEWALVKADAVVAGSSAQARNVLAMALQDIASLAADRDRTARNRDMWKDQVERQAAKLSTQNWHSIATAPRDGTQILATGGGLEHSIEIVTYHVPIGAWNAVDCTLDDRDDEPDGYCRPTHWMPLPIGLRAESAHPGSELASHEGKDAT